MLLVEWEQEGHVACKKLCHSSGSMRSAVIRSHCHPLMLSQCSLGDMKGIWPETVLPEQFSKVYFWAQCDLESNPI